MSDDKKSEEDHSRSGHLEIPGKASSLDTLGKLPPLNTPRKLLDTMEDAVIILDRGKVSRLIATFALILITIVIDTIAHSKTSASGNPTPRTNPAILSVVKPFAVGNDAANFRKLLV